MNRRLKMKIRQRYIRQGDFAKKIGLRPTVVSAVIHHRKLLSADDQKLWAHHLNCRVEDIFKR